MNKVVLIAFVVLMVLKVALSTSEGVFPDKMKDALGKISSKSDGLGDKDKTMDFEKELSVSNSVTFKANLKEKENLKEIFCTYSDSLPTLARFGETSDSGIPNRT